MSAAFRVSFAQKGGFRVFVRLKIKLANVMDGVDVSNVRAGDLLDLPDKQADVLIAEGWAEAVTDRRASDQSLPPKPTKRIEC